VNSKYKKHIQRFEELIEEFSMDIFTKRVQKRGYYGDIYYIYPEEIHDKIQGWLMKCENVISLVFGKKSIQVQRFLDVLNDTKISELDQKTYRIKGLLDADLDDLKNGFLLGQEFIIANEVFDSVLEEAKFFIFEQKNKDIGAILLRIVLEDSIKRIGKKEGIDTETKKVSVINDELKTKNHFIQTVWRQNQAWLDIGNKAAHGDFSEYDLAQVENFYNGLVNFLASEFS
jgi:hypothetical protein